MEELPSVLWSFQTITGRATRETPFSMVYGAKVILPVEIGIETAWISAYTPEDNASAQAEELDLVEKGECNLSIGWNITKHK